DAPPVRGGTGPGALVEVGERVVLGERDRLTVGGHRGGLGLAGTLGRARGPGPRGPGPGRRARTGGRPCDPGPGCGTGNAVRVLGRLTGLGRFGAGGCDPAEPAGALGAQCLVL